MPKTIKIVFYFRTLKQFAFAASAVSVFGNLTCSYFGRYIIAHSTNTAVEFEQYLCECAASPILKGSFNLRGLSIVDQSSSES